MKKHICIVIILTFILNSALIFGGSSGEGARSIPLYGHITTDTVFPEDSYIIIDDLFIDHGVRVEFEAGCDITVQTHTDPIRIWVDGDLILNGTQSKMVSLSSEAYIPAPGQWWGIVPRVLSECVFKYTTIQHAVYGVDQVWKSDLKITDSRFENMSGAGIRMNTGYAEGKIYAPKDALVEDTTFRNCEWGMIENGIDTVVRNCEFIDGKTGGILIANGTYPFSDGLRLMENTFIENKETAIQIGLDEVSDYGVTDIYLEGNEFKTSYWVRYYVKSTIQTDGLVIYRNTFREGYVDDIMKMENCKNLTLNRNDLYGNEKRHYYGLFLTGFENFHAKCNRIYNGGSGIFIRDGDNAIFDHNSFFAGSNSSSMRCDNVSNVVSHNNFGRDSGQIANWLCSPVQIFNNTLIGTGISASDSVRSRLGGDIEIFNNNITGSISCSENFRTLIHHNIIRDAPESAMFYGSKLTLDQIILVENNTISNSSRWDFKMNSWYPYQFCEVIIKNTTFDPEKVRLEWNTSIKACWFMNARTFNEIGEPIDAVMNVVNSTGIHDLDHHVSGESQLVQGPYMEFEYDWRDSHNERSDPKYQDILCNLTFTFGDSEWNTTVNWTKYLEFDVTLDGAPVFNDTGVLHFDEDTRLEFDILDHFQDLDLITVNITESDGNLTFIEGYVESTYGNWTGTSNVTFQAVDTFGNWTQGNISFVVDPVNDAPLIEPGIPDIDLDEDTIFILELAEYMYDVENDTLGWTVETGENITVELDNSTWNLTITPLSNWFGNTSIILHLNDTLLMTSVVIPVNVHSVNDVPVFDTPEDWTVTVYKGQLMKIDLRAMVTDIENDDIEFSINVTSDHITLINGELAILFPEETDVTVKTVLITASDGNDGEDMGTLLIIVEDPEAPPEDVWDLYSAEIEVDEDGVWTVEATGLPDIDVFFVITSNGEMIGTFQMEEDLDHPGNYSLTLDSDNFEVGETYSYYFTDKQGGDELEPGLWGSEVQPGKTVEQESSFWMILILGCMAVFFLFIILITIVMVLVTRKRSKNEEEE